MATPWVALCWGQLQCQVRKCCCLLNVLTVGSFSTVQGSSSGVCLRVGKMHATALTLASSKVLGASAPRLMHEGKWKESDLIILKKKYQNNEKKVIRFFQFQKVVFPPSSVTFCAKMSVLLATEMTPSVVVLFCLLI